MKRHGNLWPDVVSFEALLGAADGARRGKRFRPAVAAFHFDQERLVARPDAYPEVFHKGRGMSMRSPLPWELELLEGCLRAVPEFAQRREQDDPAREAFTVPAAGGSLALVLSWVVEDEPGSPRAT